MVYFQNPENAIKRAKEFIEVGKKNDALDTLHEVLRMRRHKQYQHDVHEPIITQYLSLCVELKKGHAAKEGLYQYKILTQNTDINSLEKVIRQFVKMAEVRAEAASKEAKAAMLEMNVIEDLDVVYTPEKLMLATVSGEDSQDRADRTVLTPWVKFLWEVYRHVLDILKNNNKVEKLYQDMAQQAFTFCIKYERKAEFRKLSDSVRNHLNLIIKHSHQTNSINLNDPVSLQLHLDTRLYQLDCAIKISLWQEAIKTINDIHALMQLSKKKPKPQALANYYKKQALVFSKANNRLFEACALMKHYQLVYDQKKTATEEEKQSLASGVLMATLAIPLPSSLSDTEKYLDLQNSTKDKNITLASYLDLAHAPTRDSLLADLVKHGIEGRVYPELQPLFTILEVDFQPLTLCKKVDTMLIQVEKLYPDLKQYTKDVREVAVLRLMRQLAQVYDKISISKVVSLIPYIEPLELELLIIGPAKSLDLQLRIDYATGTYIFGSTIQYQREDIASGPTVQQMPSEMFRSQLVSLFSALDKSVALISPNRKQQMKDQLRQEAIAAYHRSAKKDQQNMMRRKEMIESRKEFYENLNTEKEKKELQEKEKHRKEAERAEIKRRGEEEKRRTEERCQREEKHKDKLLKMEKVKKLMEHMGEKPFEGLTEEELLNMTEEDLLARGLDHMSKEKSDLQQKMKQVEKRLDYFTRAQRLVEIPKLKKEWEKAKEDDKVWWEQKENERIEMTIKKREQEISTRQRLLRMVDDKKMFEATVLEAKEAAFNSELERFESELEQIRAQRKEAKKLEILKKLAEDRKKEELARAAEEKKRKQDEENARFKKEKEESDREALKIKEAREKREREVEENKRRKEQYDDRDRYPPRDRDRGDKDRGGFYRPRQQRDRDEGFDNWRRGGGGGNSTPSRNDSPRRGGGGGRGNDGPPPSSRTDEEARPQRKKLQLQKRTVPLPSTDDRREPVGSAQRSEMGPRTIPEGRDGQQRSAPRSRGDGEEQEDGFQTVPSKKAWRPSRKYQ